MLLRLHHRGSLKMPWQHSFLHFPGEIKPQAVILSGCIFPLQIGSYHQLSHRLNLLLRNEDWGPELMIEQHPLRLLRKHMFILQLNFLRGSKLRDPIMETSKK